MRASLTLPLLATLLLTACASGPTASPSKHISQAGALRVHPGLLGQPVPAELQEPKSPAAVAPVVAEGTLPATPGAAGMQMDGIGVRTQRSVYFDYDSAALKTDYQSVVEAHGRHLAANPKAKVRIEGHADERGSAGYNQSLGQKRADNLRQALIEQGARSTQVATRSLGESRPKLKGHDEASWAENRRADIIYEREE